MDTRIRVEPNVKIRLEESVEVNADLLMEPLVTILHAARDTAPVLQGQTVWVSSAGEKSFNLRIQNISNGVEGAHAWATRMKAKLGSDYNVTGQDDCIRAEYDPKG